MTAMVKRGDVRRSMAAIDKVFTRPDGTAALARVECAGLLAVMVAAFPAAPALTQAGVEIYYRVLAEFTHADVAAAIRAAIGTLDRWPSVAQLATYSANARAARLRREHEVSRDHRSRVASECDALRQAMQDALSAGHAERVAKITADLESLLRELKGQDESE